MLQTQTIEPNTLGLLKYLMQCANFNKFNLVGGTALALQIGHRLSFDLDMFGNNPLVPDEIIDTLQLKYKVNTMSMSKNILILDVDHIKTDFVQYKYPLIDDIVEIEGIRMLSKKDIAAMKLNAIAGRGRKRDFVDLYFLLKEFTLEQLLDFYQLKYDDGSVMMVLRSLSYFDDAENDSDINFCIPNNWETIKLTINQHLNKFVQFK